jgi:hypothetical protein
VDLDVLPPMLNVAGPTDTVALVLGVLSKLASPVTSLPIGRDGTALGPDDVEAVGLLALSLRTPNGLSPPILYAGFPDAVGDPNESFFFTDATFLVLSSSFFIAMINYIFGRFIIFFCLIFELIYHHLL